MLPRNHPDRIQITFDDHRLVANAGLTLPATLARHLGPVPTPREAPRPGRRAGAAGQHRRQDALRWSPPPWPAETASTTPMRCAPVGQSVFSTAWSRRHPPWALSCAAFAGATSANWTGPGDGPFTIDLDSTICETYGLDEEGARHHGYTGKRGWYHPLLAIAAGRRRGADVPSA